MLSLFATSWTVACQAPLSMEFFRQKYWTMLPFPTGIEPTYLVILALAGRFFTTEKPGKPSYMYIYTFFGSSVARLCSTLCNPMDCSMPSFLVLFSFPEFDQTHVPWVDDAIQPSHPLLPPSLPSFNLSQHQGLFQWVGSSRQVAKVLEIQIQHQFFQWIFRADFF